jgi:hypothetical protein
MLAFTLNTTGDALCGAPVFDFRQQTPQDQRIILPAGLSSIIFKSSKSLAD